jgi:YD repeat-containing protein
VILQVTRSGAWILDLRTQTMEQVLDDPTAEEFAWDPDGRRVAYHSKRGGEWRIWIVPLPL